MASKHEVRIKRVYDEPVKADGYRILVDRIWPRGVSKTEAHVDEWLKEAGPSNELRHWFGHVPERYEEFAEKYRAELNGSEVLAQLRERCREHSTVTLVYSAKDTEHNQAVVLQELLK